ncbi:hypothetical protein [Roseicella aquatilis]|uniref:Uncharacterized protein n=1 Tax=Roseicella aquatilis TaxID=2527868 RepID=A0A4R4DR69_9PROT|nr:hypothetical protein [Roseicella aquatilis]TCZ64857.1 hypothetical protein EXY23_05640 [Roseicella aquatilis]
MTGDDTVPGAGTVLAVRGSVLDLGFAPGDLPAVNEAAEIAWDMTPEPLVAHRVRGVAPRDTGACVAAESLGLAAGTLAAGP